MNPSILTCQISILTAENEKRVAQLQKQKQAVKTQNTSSES